MSIDVSRIEKVEVSVTVPVIHADVRSAQLAAILRERDAKELMHALALALGYLVTPQ